jgi:hypothetical protein
MNDFQRKKRALESRKLKLEQDKAELLFSYSWTYTSAFPDSCWRWSKEISSGRFTTSQADDALSIQARLEEGV